MYKHLYLYLSIYITLLICHLFSETYSKIENLMDDLNLKLCFLTFSIHSLVYPFACALVNNLGSTVIWDG